jgi:uncharacterized protein (DUF169 family)
MGEGKTLGTQEAATALERYLRPETFPLAIRVVRGGEALPERVRRPHANYGIKVSICQGISMARRYGWTVGMGADDVCCPIAEVAFGFQPAVSYYDEGNLAAGMYVAACAQGARSEASIPKFTPEESGVVVAGPLARANFVPEAILFYGNSAQVLIAVGAALWHTGGALTSSTSARADCADIVIRTTKEDRAQFILPCGGDRIFGHTQDHEMAFAIPWAQVPALLEGLEGMHKGGIRYPITHFLRYTPSWPDNYEKLHEIWQQESGQ